MRNPDYVPAGHALVKDGDRITHLCMMWSQVNHCWQEVSPLLVGRTFQRSEFQNVFFSKPRTDQRIHL